MRRIISTAAGPAAVSTRTGHLATSLASWLLGTLLFIPTLAAAAARYDGQRPQVHSVSMPTEIDAAIDLQGRASATSDTTWIADWSFDGGDPCDAMGWKAGLARAPVYPLFWHVGTEYGGVGGISGAAAILGTHDPCWVIPDGYGNDWYQAVAVRYRGRTLLAADYLVDSEADFDFFQVEVDSGCASRNVDAARDILFSDSGLVTMGSLSTLILPDFDAPGDTHCVYLAFFSDGGFSQQDGIQETTLGAGLVLDHIALADAGEPGSPTLITLTENFAGPLHPLVSFTNLEEPPPDAGSWARLHRFPSSAVPCARDGTCAWIFTDPDLVCGQSANIGCVPLGIDNVIISPWVSLASTLNASGTVLSFRQLPGQSTTRIVWNWAVRGRVQVDSVTCVSDWGHAFQFNGLRGFDWKTLISDMTPYLDPTSEAIQVRFRVADWADIGGGPGLPNTLGPGPYIDRVRIGRRILSGPLFAAGVDTRSQAQDAFPTAVDPTFPAGVGEHHRPTTDRFGTCAFSMGAELGINRTSPRLITGDSIWVQVRDARGAGGITAIDFYGAIVRGPHTGKSPPPWPVDANGFFRVPADSVRSAFSGVPMAEFYFVDLDDDYFRGGDELQYFWLATDVLGGVTSFPAGLTGVPGSIPAAQTATLGLFEVSFLPTITWAPPYLARIAADPHGKLEPTPAELVNSWQKNCVLYAQTVNPRRRGGDLHRTSFMYRLDHGSLYGNFYRGHYDIYDVQGYGNTNNQLGGRATVEQAEGYNVIVYDTGNHAPGGPVLPDGSDLDAEKIDQAGWFRTWLARASSSEAGFVTLWLLGANVAEEKSSHPLLASDMGIVLAGASQPLGPSPEVEGQTSFIFDQGPGSATVNWSGDRFSLAGGCLALPTPINPARTRSYDAIEASGAAVVTHRYRTSTQLGPGAVVMNRNPAQDWNTILMSFAWLDIHDPFGSGTPWAYPPETRLMTKIISGVLPVACLPSPPPTAVAEGPRGAIPPRTALHANTPNPFNPVTTLRFDLASPGRVELCIYDVAGRLVRRLIDAERAPARHQVVWDGLDAQGTAVPTGIYLARLRAAGFDGSRKLVVLR